MKSQNLFRIVVVLLLSAMLAAQIMILQRMPKPPVTVGDVFGYVSDKNPDVWDRMPIVQVYSVKRPVELEEPVKVEIDDVSGLITTSLPVQIWRRE